MVQVSFMVGAAIGDADYKQTLAGTMMEDWNRDAEYGFPASGERLMITRINSKLPMDASTVFWDQAAAVWLWRA